MDYEKAYKEAMEKVRSLHDNANEISKLIDLREELEGIFPELKESADERIRKEMIEILKKEAHDFPASVIAEKSNSWIAWLEKQGEMDMEFYKAAEDEKREFIGDGFIKCYANFQDFKEGETYWLEYVGNDNYNVRSDNLLGKTYHITPCHLYTIFKKQTWLEKQGEQKHTAEEVLIKAGLKPYKDGDQWCVLLGDNIQEGICGFGNTIEDALYAFLKDLIASQGEQKPAEWSEEDESKRKLCFYYLTAQKNYQTAVGIDYINGCLDWLDSIKERVLPQPKQEWSEEDKQLYNDLSDTYFYNDEDYPEETYKLMLKRVLDWMTKRAKSLRPQSTWKPTEQQMKVLNEVINFAADHGTMRWNDYIYNVLKGLREQLKKLREE